MDCINFESYAISAILLMLVKYMLFLYLRGENLTSRFGLKVVLVKIARRELLVDLMVLKMVAYDMILGMD